MEVEGAAAAELPAEPVPLPVGGVRAVGDIGAEEAAEEKRRIAAEEEAKRVAAEEEAKRIAAEEEEAKRIAAEEEEAKRITAEAANVAGKFTDIRAETKKAFEKVESTFAAELSSAVQKIDSQFAVIAADAEKGNDEIFVAIDRVKHTIRSEAETAAEATQVAQKACEDKIEEMAIAAADALAKTITESEAKFAGVSNAFTVVRQAIGVDKDGNLTRPGDESSESLSLEGGNVMEMLSHQRLLSGGADISRHYIISDLPPALFQLASSRSAPRARSE